MNAVEMVKEICKQKNIPISRLERECGFSNGYISKLKKGCFPIDKAERIANYLNLDVNILADSTNYLRFRKPNICSDLSIIKKGSLFNSP